MADCEALHDGLLDQPVNALSSLAYVAAGVAVYRRNRLHGGALMAVGAGSFAFHASESPAAHWLHDTSIVALAALAAWAAPRVWVAAPFHPRLATASATAFALALPLQLFGRTGGPLCRPESVLQAHAGWHIGTAVALAGVFTLAARARTAPVPARTG